jgi:hypothetical protein
VLVLVLRCNYNGDRHPAEILTLCWNMRFGYATHMRKQCVRIQTCGNIMIFDAWKCGTSAEHMRKTCGNSADIWKTCRTYAEIRNNWNKYGNTWNTLQICSNGAEQIRKCGKGVTTMHCRTPYHLQILSNFELLICNLRCVLYICMCCFVFAFSYDFSYVSA